MSELKTLLDLVNNAAEDYPEVVFLREYVNKELKDTSFKLFRELSQRVASWIKDKFSERIHAAVIGTTSSQYLEAWFGIQLSGNVSVPLDVSNRLENIADEIDRSDSQIVFLDGRLVKALELFKTKCPKVKYFVNLDEKSEGTLYLGDIIAEYEGKTVEATVDENETAAILFTSGTTGRSKGVMLSHANLIDNTTCCPDDKYHDVKLLSVLPIHHVYCLTMDILHSLWSGVTVCVNDSLMHIPRNLKMFEPDYCTVVPMIAATILGKMQQAAKKIPDKKAIGAATFGTNLKALYSGGAYLSPDIIAGYREFGIDISQGYGMTECSPRICTGVINCLKPDSVGKIVDGCEVKIVDGEIWVKSPSVMKGYYNDPEETKNSLTPDGWLMTGDLGHKDDDGYLYITGRKKNLIILSNGENVSPEEIENRFASFLPIKEMVVYADGSIITAQIFPNEEYPSEDIQAEIRAKVDEVNESFPPAKRIVNVIFRDREFVKTASRKIIRAKINE